MRMSHPFGYSRGMVTDPLVATYVNEQAVTGQWRPTTVRLRSWQLDTFGRYLQSVGKTLDTCERGDFIGFLAGYDDSQQRRSFFFAIRGMFRSLILDGLVSNTDPTARLTPASLESGLPRPIPNHLFWESYNLADDRERAMLTLARFAGLRVSEIAASHGAWLIGDNVHVPGKGGRVDPIPAHERIRDVMAGQGFLFPTCSGRATLPHVRSDTISALGSAALPAGWTMHTLRHAFITEVYETSGDLGVAQTAARHRSPVTTRIYARLADSRIRAIVQDLDAGLPRVA